MFCKNCGASLLEGSYSCPYCGSQVTESTPASSSQPYQQAPQQPYQQAPQQPYQQAPQQPYQQAPQQPYQQPYQQPMYPPYPQPNAYMLPMKWFKFLIYFSLWAGAVLNLINGIMLLTGGVYDGQADFVYGVLDGIQTIDMIVGFLSIALAVFGIYTRFRLAGYYKNGPSSLTILYVGSIIVNLVYIIGVYSILAGYDLSDIIDVSSFISGSVMSAVMIFANISYFNKRKHLFVN